MGRKEGLISRGPTRVHSWSSRTPVPKLHLVLLSHAQNRECKNRFPPTAAVKPCHAAAGQESAYKSPWICLTSEAPAASTDQQFQHHCHSPARFLSQGSPCTSCLLVHNWFTPQLGWAFSYTYHFLKKMFKQFHVKCKKKKQPGD